MQPSCRRRFLTWQGNRGNRLIFIVLPFTMMKLETAQSLHFANATAEDIRRAVTEDKLRGEYLILYRTRDCFVQAAGDTEPFLVEYRDERGTSSHRCRQPLTSADLEQLLLRYLENDTAWNTGYDWDTVPDKPWWKFW